MKEINLIQPIIGDIYNNRRGIIFFRRNSKNKKGQNYFNMATPTLVDCWLVHSWVELVMEWLNQLLVEQPAIQSLLLSTSFQVPLHKIRSNSQFFKFTSVVIFSLFGFSSFPSSIGSLFSPNVGVATSLPLLLSLFSTSETAAETASPPPLVVSFVEAFSLIDGSSVAVTVAFWSFSVSGSESEFS